jgi:lysophosphatidate acyltransferase
MPSESAGPGGALRRAAYHVHFVVACLLGGFLFFVLAAAALVHYALFRNGESAALVWIRGWAATMTRVLGWRVAVEDLDTLHATSPAVVVGNHQSNLDTVPWASFFPRRSVAVGKKEILKVPFFGWLWKATNNILIDRSNSESARRSIAEAAARIRDERLNVWILPEGHRNDKPEMLPFKKGAFHLAIAAQVPILPFVTSPMWEHLDAERWMVRPGTVTVRFLPPIATEGMTEADVDRLSLAAREAIEAQRQVFNRRAGLRIG